MSEPESDKGPKKIRFLSFANSKEDEQKLAKLKEAAARIENAINKDKNLDELVTYRAPEENDQFDPAKDTRSLHERLSEQKKKKQDEIEESHKLSNMVSKLDEDDVEYLNEVAKSQREEELKKRLEIYDLLEEKKRFDERKSLEEEQRNKDSLISHYKSGARPRSSTSRESLKMKIGSKIKVKPKLKKPND